MKAQKLGQVAALLSVVLMLGVSACGTPGKCTLGNDAADCPAGAYCYGGEEAKAGDAGVCTYSDKLTISEFSPLQARHGEVLTISGKNFSNVPSGNNVTLNGVAAEVQSATETEIKITVPKNLRCSGPVRVTVNGLTAISSDTFTYVPTVNVTTFAGSGEAGFDEGHGSEARLSYPVDVTVDAAGNLYVADNNNGGIDKITPDADVSLYVGVGAGVEIPWGIAMDAANNLYVTMTTTTTTGSNASFYVQKILPSRELRDTIGGTPGFADGPQNLAQFRDPHGIATDAQGNLYVADTKNNRIRKISPQGDVSTLAGSGSAGHRDAAGTQAHFNNPWGITLDASGNLYVADWMSHRIRKISPQGVVSTLAGNGSAGHRDAAGTLAQFNGPCGITLDAAGNLYVADSFNHRIRKITLE